mmetsp:Transcript_151885/g.487420  ORF Transcript_151885/g.487420 Transcript_151885/m.487420 type:complete len:264 (-) Transcript_151885:247-1038(-)
MGLPRGHRARSRPAPLPKPAAADLVPNLGQPPARISRTRRADCRCAVLVAVVRGSVQGRHRDVLSVEFDVSLSSRARSCTRKRQCLDHAGSRLGPGTDVFLAWPRYAERGCSLCCRSQGGDDRGVRGSGPEEGTRGREGAGARFEIRPRLPCIFPRLLPSRGLVRRSPHSLRPLPRPSGRALCPPRSGEPLLAMVGQHVDQPVGHVGGLGASAPLQAAPALLVAHGPAKGFAVLALPVDAACARPPAGGGGGVRHLLLRASDR